jgi:hypothetical protein
MSADNEIYEAVRRVYRTHAAYRRRGDARSRAGSGVTESAADAARDLGVILDARRQQLYDALVASPPVSLGDAIGAVSVLADEDPRFAWQLHRFLRSVRKSNRLSKTDLNATRPPAGTAPATLFSDHIAEVCQQYRKVIDATNDAGGRRHKRILRREAEDALSRNLCAFQFLAAAGRDEQFAPQLAAAAAAAIS